MIQIYPDNYFFPIIQVMPANREWKWELKEDRYTKILHEIDEEFVQEAASE